MGLSNKYQLSLGRPRQCFLVIFTVIRLNNRVNQKAAIYNVNM